MQTGDVQVRLGRLHYRSTGAGRPLVLLHQPPRSGRVYRRLMQALDALGGIRAIAFDLPGFGRSCDLPEGESISGIANTIAEAMAALGMERASVFGLHTGNKIGAALAAAHPNRVDRLVLAGMTHSIILDAQARNAAMQEYVRRKVPTDPDRSPEAWQDEQADRAQARGYETLYAANYGFDLASALERVAAPTLMIELAVAQEAGLGRQAAAICRRMPRARPLQIDCDDRTLLQERPGELARAIRDFVLEGENAS